MIMSKFGQTALKTVAAFDKNPLQKHPRARDLPPDDTQVPIKLDLPPGDGFVWERTLKQIIQSSPNFLSTKI